MDALRRTLERFPAYVRTRGADYFHRRRVGSIELRPDTIQAKVYGTRAYKSGWLWNGSEAIPQCSCPVGPYCKHAYALALAVLREHDRGGGVGSATWTERPSSSVATELEEWAHRHTSAPSRSLRVVLGLENREDGPGVVLEARVTSPRLKDQTRSQQQIAQMVYDAQGGRRWLSPPQARLARLLAERVRGLPERHGHTIEVTVVALNQLLDAFPSSPFVTWGPPLDPHLAARAGVVAGARARLEDGLVDVAPVCLVKGEAMRISLAVRWPDGRQRGLDEVVYLYSHDDLHPSLVLAEGGFWRVNEEPPRALLMRLAGDAGVEVPIKGRERFLELLAASFDSVAEALAPLTRVHRTHPIVVMELERERLAERAALCRVRSRVAARPGRGRGVRARRRGALGAPHRARLHGGRVWRPWRRGSPRNSPRMPRALPPSNPPATGCWTCPIPIRCATPGSGCRRCRW